MKFVDDDDDDNDSVSMSAVLVTGPILTQNWLFLSGSGRDYCQYSMRLPREERPGIL